jgi:2-hydroxy-3-oxopropionate reductase
MPDTVGFIGLGVMGRPMASNLLEAGSDVVVHSRSPGPVDELVAAGARRGSSPRDVAAQTEATILMLPDDEAVGTVVEGPEGVLAGAREGHLLVDMSTVSPDQDRRLAEAADRQGVAMLDAPVSGGDAGAREGTLSIMVGGTEDALEGARPLLEVLGKTIVHVGPSGSGQVVKACNQVVVALTIEAVAEGLVLGSKAGVDPERIAEVLAGGLAGSKVLEMRGPNMLAHSYEPGFTIDLHHKDLGIAVRTAREHGVSLPGTELVEQAMAELRERGQGGHDHSALATRLEALADHRIGS